MDLARVVGNVVCTIKNPGLSGSTLLLVQPLDREGRERGEPLVAVDSVGAGAGELVFYVTGREASFAFLPDRVVPTDASVVGIVDSVGYLDEADAPGRPLADWGRGRGGPEGSGAAATPTGGPEGPGAAADPTSGPEGPGAPADPAGNPEGRDDG